jgi:23S rRNA (cytosine1962-C5)-methyltransferase
VAWNAGQPLDAGFWRSRLQHAVAARDPARSACRLVHAESDGLPGLIVDRYGSWLVLQALTLGIERRKEALAADLLALTGARGIYERSDGESRAKEGLESECRLLAGEEPPDPIEIEEPSTNGNLRFLVDVRRGHKTGFYLDQAENRRRIAAYCEGAVVLNLFAYTGAVACHALRAGARRVINVDSSRAALDLAARNLELNGCAANGEDLVEADVPSFLRRCREQRERFDVIVTDPPKFAQSQSQVEKAARAYKDINLIAMQLLRPGGILATFSCSGLVSADLFQKILFGASCDAGRDSHIIERLGQPADHPVRLSFPEGEYLKGLVCRIW